MSPHTIAHGRRHPALAAGLAWLSFVLVVVARLAGAETPAFKQVRIAGAVVSLPGGWKDLGAEVPVWLHLHGAAATVEAQFVASGAAGVLVNVTLPGLSRVYADRFAAAGALGELLQRVEKVLATESPTQPRRLGRLTVSSFSAGFGGVRAMLRDETAFVRIAALVMVDSIYCGYAGEPSARKVDEELMAGFLRFAEAAAKGEKRLVISHSAQVPDGYASTTETADYLITKLGGARTPRTEDWGGGLRLVSAFAKGQAEIFGFSGAAADDHMRHLREMAPLLKRALPAAASSVAELRARLRALVAQPRFSGALWGVEVGSLDSGATIFVHHADRLMSPASNSKLYTGALALDRVGGDYRIVTPIFGAAKPDANGRVAGDVIVSGRGDPSWRVRGTSRDFWEIFAPFVTALRNAGVKRIAGDLVADATWFRGPPNGAGWTADDLNESYGAEISAITLEQNYADLRVVPGAVAGAPVAVQLLQPHTGLTLDNRLVTFAKGPPRRIEARRIIGETVVHLFGEVALETKPEPFELTVPRPAQWFAAALKEALNRAGIRVDGAARSLRWPETTAVTSASAPLGEVVSPPMRELVAAFMKPSQNLETDLIFGHLGEKFRADDAPARLTTEDSAVRLLREFLTANNLPADDVRFEEGSGLSRNNLTSARATVALLRTMARHREAEAFAASLPIAGVDGTLRRRLKATAAEGNVKAKTGTLRYANGLSGYVTTAAGERLAFSLLLNRYVPPAGRRAIDELDEVAVLLAGLSTRSSAPKPAAAAPAPGKSQ